MSVTESFVDAAELRSETAICADRDVFRRNFDNRDFDFGHRLAKSPLFELGALRELTKEMARDSADVFYDVGDVRVNQRWEDVPPAKLSINELLENIEHESGWILLRRADKFPAYAALLDACIAEIEDLVGRDLKPLMAKRRALIFISSPNRVSSYHIDRECNWLLQVRGKKSISIFDRNDRDVLPISEIERFWTVDNNAAVYKPQLQERARTYELVPGRAVHIPVNAPHWVKNGSDVSVSLSINFHYHEARLADIYRMNYWMRRVGFDPVPPGHSALADGIKRFVYGSARVGWRTLRQKPLRRS